MDDEGKKEKNKEKCKRYRENVKLKEIANKKRKASYDPAARKASHEATYDPVARKASHEATYDPVARKASHEASYDPAAREASYVSQLPQWSLTNVDKIPQHMKVKQEWGYGEDEKCQHCKCIFLRSSSDSFRRKCCNNGTFNTSIPHLEPLLETLLQIVEDDESTFKDFNSASSSYNNILSLGESPHYNMLCIHISFMYIVHIHTRSNGSRERQWRWLVP